MRTLVTGGCGFIGSAVCRHLVADRGEEVVNLDKQTYAADPRSLEETADDPRYTLIKMDVVDRAAVQQVFQATQPDAVIHLAAETHVDRSIDGPSVFVRTNVLGTEAMLQATLQYWRGLPAERSGRFRFLHVSTDEVYGSLEPAEARFTERSRYDPRSPYAASKAAADHLVRAWAHTYGLPVVVSNCSNNFGPYQFPEKLIPLTIINALEGRAIPVYGDGRQVRDWLHVDDHVRALVTLRDAPQAGGTYLVGGDSERSNLSVVEEVCDLVDDMGAPLPRGAPRRTLIRFVTDRPGHDRRYAVDASRLRGEFGWAPQRPFSQALRDTVGWYLSNQPWWMSLRERYAGQRLGLNDAANL